MSKKGGGTTVIAPQPDPALQLQIDTLSKQIDSDRLVQQQQSAEFMRREESYLSTQNDLIAQRSASDALAQNLADTNAKIAEAQRTAAAMQTPTTAPGTPVTEITDDAATVAEVTRRRAAETKARRGRSALLIPALGTGAMGAGLALPTQ